MATRSIRQEAAENAGLDRKLADLTGKSKWDLKQVIFSTGKKFIAALMSHTAFYS
jgi:hypothetical protein